MNIFQRAVAKIVGAPITGGGINFGSVFTSNSKTVDTAELFDYFIGYPHAAITAISDEVAKTEFYVVEINPKTGVEIEKPNHPFIKVLDNPNPEMSTFGLLEASDTFYSFVGEFFWFIVRGERTGLPMEFHPINPLNMTELIDTETGELKGWKFRGYKGTEEVLQKYEVLHVKNHNPRNPHRGWGVMQAAINQVLVEYYGMEFTKNFLANNAFPGGVYNIKKDISKELFDKFKDNLRSSYSGTSNAGKLMVLKNADGEFQKLGSNLQEVALKDLKDVTSESILNMFRLPKQILGIPDNINLATSQVLETTYAKRTIKPRLDRIVQGNQRLLDEYTRAVNRGRTNKIVYELRYREIVPEDAEKQLKAIESGIKNHYLTPNEAREHSPFQLDPIEGGDNVLGDPNLMPIGQPISKNKKPKNGHIKVTKTIKTTPVAKVTKHPEITIEAFNEYRRAKWSDLNSSGAEVEASLTAYWKSQAKRVVSAVKPKALKEKAFEGILFDVTDEAAKLKAAVEPAFREASKEQYEIAATLASSATDKAYADYAEQLDAFIVYRLDSFVDSSLKGVRDQLTSVLTQAAQDGLTAAETARRIEDVYKSVSSKKTMMIARTELNAIANKAAATAYTEYGFTYKQWFANPGACEYCRSLDGNVTGMEATFVKTGEVIEGTDGGKLNNNYLDIKEPPAHTNCKCDLIPANEAATPFGKLPPLSDREELADVV